MPIRIGNRVYPDQPSADDSPQAQNFNAWLRQMFGRAPVLGDNTLQFDENYARALGMPEAEIQRRKAQPKSSLPADR
jgi:hypothetical protein